MEYARIGIKGIRVRIYLAQPLEALGEEVWVRTRLGSSFSAHNVVRAAAISLGTCGDTSWGLIFGVGVGVSR
jgi:hypothetical protein